MGKLQKLKSLIKLNKLFHYQFIIHKELFYKLKIRVYFIEIDDEYIICYGNKKVLNQLVDYDIKYFNQYKIFIKTVFIKRIVFYVTFIMMCMIFFSSSLFIRDIRFKDSSMYDYRVYNYLYQKLDKKWFLYTLNEDINSLSLSLRAAFPNYSYIGLIKSGSTLVIDVEKIDRFNEYKPHKEPFPIVSNYNAVIYGISCLEGVVLVNLNQSIKKGEVLVTPSLEGGFTSAIVLGKMAEYVTITVKKKKLCFENTGKMKSRFGIKVGKNYLQKFKDFYEFQDIKIINRINLFNFLSLVEVYYYEKDYLLIEYDYNTAYNYAVSMIYANLEIYRKSNLEKINEIKLLNHYENSDEYVFHFLINQIKSIGIYSYN